MQTSRRRRLPEQMILFDPPRKLPRWESLPSGVRRGGVVLMARMLREHLVRRPVGDEEGGADNE